MPAAGAFTVKVNGSPVALAASGAVAVGEAAVTLTLAQAVAAGARVTLDYTVPGDKPIRDLAGNAAAPCSGSSWAMRPGTRGCRVSATPR